MENITANIGASLSLGKFKVSPNYQYVGERKGTLATDTTNTIQTVSPYGLLNLHLSYTMNNKITLSISAHNLLNEEYYYPELVRRKILTIPGGPGRMFFLKFTYKVY